MQAIILAAGMGKRLKELTSDRTKCMIKVNGVPLIERMLLQLENLGLSRIIIVIGYHGEDLKEFVLSLNLKTQIIFVENEVYYKTNNIYSLYLAKEYLVEEDTLLFESDLIFEDKILNKLAENDYPDLVLVAKYESWMDGTVVTFDEDRNIVRFLGKHEFDFSEINTYYKTVNIYKFSKDFSITHYVPFLEAYSKALGDNEYYEQVLKVISLLEEPKIKVLPLEDEKWYEVDDIQDLDIAESIFTKSKTDKLEKIQKRYGGYWRYPKLLDFCYLVNPYYPSRKLIEEIEANLDSLIRMYPSGLDVNNLLIAKYFGLKKDYVCIGNGASELIKALVSKIPNKVGITIPTFEEYPNRLAKENIVYFKVDNKDFSYSYKNLIDYFDNKDISSLLLVNPDNPSGNYINKEGVLELIKWSYKKNINLIVDESFIDFTDTDISETLLENKIISEYPNLIVLKSISKSFGVPGLRIGLIASSDSRLINYIRSELAIWNINSFAEFYLQIFEKYKDTYREAINKFRYTRKDFFKELEMIEFIRPIPTQANYILCEVNGSAKQLTEILLNDYNIFIKDLSQKKGFEDKQYVRLNIKTREENYSLVRALKDLQSKNKLN